MRLLQLVAIAAVSLGFSCSRRPGEPTPIASATTPIAASLPHAWQPLPSWTFHGFHGQWAVFGAPDGTTTVVDLKTHESAHYAGLPMSDPYEDESARTSEDGRYLLLQSAGRVEVADLKRASIVQLYEGEVVDAELGAHDRALVARAPNALHFIALAGGRHTVVPFGNVLTSGLQWGERGARFFTGKAWQFFDETTWQVWSPPAGAELLEYHEDGQMLFLHGTSLELWSLGDDEPRATRPAWALAASRPSEDGFFESYASDRTVAYSVGTMAHGERVFDFHVSTWDDESELVFRGVGRCGPAPEEIVAIDEAEIKTNVSCSVGCPSDTAPAESAIYDRHTGALLRRVTDADDVDEPPVPPAKPADSFVAVPTETGYSVQDAQTGKERFSIGS